MRARVDPNQPLWTDLGSWDLRLLEIECYSRKFGNSNFLEFECWHITFQVELMEFDIKGALFVS